MGHEAYKQMGWTPPNKRIPDIQYSFQSRFDAWIWDEVWKLTLITTGWQYVFLSIWVPNCLSSYGLCSPWLIMVYQTPKPYPALALSLLLLAIQLFILLHLVILVLEINLCKSLKSLATHGILVSFRKNDYTEFAPIPCMNLSFLYFLMSLYCMNMLMHEMECF